MTHLATIIFSGRQWFWPGVVAAVILLAAVLWSNRRTAVNQWIKTACGLLKLLGIAVLLLCLLEPMWISQRARPGANIFAVLADNSQSMQVKDTGESQTRGEIVQRELTDDKNWQAALTENFQLRRYTFDSRLQNSRNFGELNFQGRASALGASLRSAMEHWHGQPVAGVLLFTDGNATDLAAGLPPLEGCPPVYPVVSGGDAEIHDLALKKVDVSQTAFEDAPVTVQARIAANGFAGSTIAARLTEVAVGSSGMNAKSGTSGDYQISTSSNVVSELTQRASGDEADLNFRFQIQPDKPGIHFYELETRAREALPKSRAAGNEATLVNNRQMLVVDRGQEPLRVLYVSGRPNWEYKFLNRAIQEDSQVQMVSLIRVARREPKFDFKGRAGESSNPLFRGFDQKNEETARYDQPVLVRLNTKDELELRGGFPKTAEELFQYKAVILDDLEAEFFTRDQLTLLQRFVSERGGGLLMLGGAESFREGNYAGTTIASMLPVYLDRPVDVSLPEQLKLTLTREGWLQPWTRLRTTEAEEKERLDAMPGFEVLNAVRDIKPGASVLATVSDFAGHTYPALAVQRFGAGRSAALMIGDLWRWGFRDEAMQKDLGKAWRQLVRWLVADVPARVSVASEKSDDGDSAEVRLTVKARDEEFKPLDNATVQLIVRPVRLADSVESASRTNYVRLTAEPSVREPGSYSATYIARDAGAYSVEALVTQADGKVIGKAVMGWASDPAVEEFRSLKPNRALLENLAKRTGGEMVNRADLESFVRRLPDRRAPITETASSPLWHQPLVFLFALGCFVAEWGIRRWKGAP